MGQTVVVSSTVIVLTLVWSYVEPPWGTDSARSTLPSSRISEAFMAVAVSAGRELRNASSTKYNRDIEEM